MDVTPQELRSNEIKETWRGYDRDEVDDLLERAAVTIEGLTQQLHDVQSRPVPAAAPAPAATEVPLPSSREDADMLQRTLVLAQRAADDAVNEAQARAKQMLEDSEAKAQSLVSDAEATARRIAEGERRRLESEILDRSSRREQLRTDADALDEYVAGYRQRIRAAIEADLANLGAEVEPPTARPELHEVDLPDAAEPEPTALTAAVVDSAAPESATPSEEPLESGPGTHAIEGLDGTGSEAAGVESPAPAAFGGEGITSRSAAAAAAPSEPAAEWPPAPASEASTPPNAAGAAESSWLGAGETDWSASGTAWDAPAPWEREGATPEASVPSEVPMEANAVDTDALDDDAFFASLREAVRDDAPLGPRDDEQGGAYDEAEQERRRFRRRR